MTQYINNDDSYVNNSNKINKNNDYSEESEFESTTSADSSVLNNSDGAESDSSSDELVSPKPQVETGEVKEEEELCVGDDDYVPGTFEGPEKNLCVEFQPGFGHENGCRELDRSSLDAICAAAKCTILSSISNQYVDAYVLSESSLFVFKNKIIMKTCGTTTLLRCLMPLLKFTDNLGMEIDWVGYSRKNFSFPDSQCFPHCSFHEEFEYLKSHPQLEMRVNGEGYILGPITKDHFMAYVSDRSTSLTRDFISDDVTINIMMFELNESVTPIFYKKNNATAKVMSEISGISDLCPGFDMDDHAFEPCGYSMNAISSTTNGDGDAAAYSTIHITPERECSYASFETNLKLASYTSLIEKVVNVFKPGRIVITILADNIGLETLTDSPFDHDNITINAPLPASSSNNTDDDDAAAAVMNYKRSCFSSTKVAGESCVLMGIWELGK